jgi:predicted transcriptional regulator
VDDGESAVIRVHSFADERARLTGSRSCGSMRGMSITIELPPDVEKRLAALPDLGQRVADFLRGQAELEQWREQRYSAKVREIVRESLAEADAAKAQGVSREEAFREFFDVYDRITAQLAGKR